MTERISQSQDPKLENFFRQCDTMMEGLEIRKGKRQPLISEWEETLRLQGKTLNDFPVPEYDFRVGNSTVSLAGYWHDLPYYEAHKEQVQRHIAGSTVLVTELAQLAEGAFKNTQGYYEDFFQKIERVAWDNKVPLVCDDQNQHERIKKSRMPVNFNHDLYEADMNLQGIKIGVFLASVATISAALGIDVHRKYPSIFNKLEEKAEAPLLSRRSVVFGGLAATTATMSASSLYGAFVNLPLPQPYLRRHNNPAGPLIMDREDYRDVATAYTILKMAKDLPRGSRISVVYGVGHMRPIKHYLDKPLELILKMALYQAAYGDTIPKSVVYTPTGMDLSRRAPEASWVPEQREDFSARISRERRAVKVN